MSEQKVEGFELGLASVDAYDPQSFIDGAKWQAARQSPAPIPEQVAQEVTQQAAKAETAEQAFNSLYSAVMNIPCERTMSHFVTQADMRLYKDGHRDARHAAVDLIAEFASRFRAQGGNTNTESSGLAPTTSTVSASSALAAADDVRDAGRYRWLRERNNNLDAVTEAGAIVFGKRLDQAIDAEMQMTTAAQAATDKSED